MKGKIFIHDWIDMKPYSSHASSDLYYLKLSNEVKKILLRPEGTSIFRFIDSEKELNHLACFLTSYLEDIVSGTNLWNTFVRLHADMYQKLIPFYDTDDYFEEEINPQDIAILIWYYLNTIQDKQFLSAHSDFIFKLAKSIFRIFETEYEYAPENNKLGKYYKLDENEDDYYVVRKMVDDVLFKSYLFYPDTAKALERLVDETIDMSKDSPNLLAYLQDNRDRLLHKVHTQLFSKRGNEWVAEILGKDHPLYFDLLEISPKIFGYFLYIEQDDNYILFEHVASGEQFQLTKRSYDDSSELSETDILIYMSIVRWQKEWWFSGVQMINEYNEELLATERASALQKNSINFLDRYRQTASEVLEKQKNAFLEFNNGNLIAFMPTGEIHTFTQDFFDFYNDKVKKDWKGSIDNIKKELVEKHEKQIMDAEFQAYLDIGLVFFNAKSGLEIGFGINSAFPHPENPYFQESESNEDVMYLMECDQFSKELVMFCLDNFKDKLQFFKENNRAKYLDDFDFLLRFWKGEHYHSKPSITIY